MAKEKKQNDKNSSAFADKTQPARGVVLHEDPKPLPERRGTGMARYPESVEQYDRHSSMPGHHYRRPDSELFQEISELFKNDVTFHAGDIVIPKIAVA